MSPFSSCPLKAWCIVEEVVRWKLLPRANKAILWVWMCASKNYSRDYGQTSWGWDGHNATRFGKAMKNLVWGSTDTARLLRKPHWWPFCTPVKRDYKKGDITDNLQDESVQVIGFHLSRCLVEYQVMTIIHYTSTLDVALFCLCVADIAVQLSMCCKS